MDEDRLNRERWPTSLALISILSEGISKQFVIAGLLGLALDLLLFQVLVAVGAKTALSQVTSFFVGIIFSVKAGRTFVQPKPPADALIYYTRLVTLSLLALFIRSAVLLLLVTTWHWPPQVAIILAVLPGAAVFFIGLAMFVFSQTEPNETTAFRWRIVTIAVLAYVLPLRLVFIALVDLIPEEAYYWNYAQHLDLSYLDHPPMVAWLIWAFTSALGKSELSVRLPAYICWIIAALFMFRLTVKLFDTATALRAILLLAVLPIYFGLGFFMTPDAPLYAAWAGCLYFLALALLDQNPRAWWGVGVCMGLGLLAKYTAALLGLGTLVFVGIDKRSRWWLLRPEPYLAGAVAVAFFIPVLLWNMEHDWVSFTFQGPDRWRATPKFSLHVLIGSFFLLLTPTALFGIAKVLLPERPLQVITERRRQLWVLTFTLLPLSVFVFYSFQHQVKLNWTAPIWLAAIPLLAWDMVPRPQQIAGWSTKLIRRLWMPTIVGLLIIHGTVFNYISLGLPGAGPIATGRLFRPWRLIGDNIEKIEALVEAETKSEPILVGMDRNLISSELSFYDFVDQDAAMNTGATHFFGGRSLMWAYWFPVSAALGRNFLMVDFDPKRLLNPSLPLFFEKIGDLSKINLEKEGRAVGYLYWRVGYGYRGLAVNTDIRKTRDPRPKFDSDDEDERQ